MRKSIWSLSLWLVQYWLVGASWPFSFRLRWLPVLLFFKYIEGKVQPNLLGLLSFVPSQQKGARPVSGHNCQPSRGEKMFWLIFWYFEVCETALTSQFLSAMGSLVVSVMGMAIGLVMWSILGLVLMSSIGLIMGRSCSRTFWVMWLVMGSIACFVYNNCSDILKWHYPSTTTVRL